jgi:hypothetical protein
MVYSIRNLLSDRPAAVLLRGKFLWALAVVLDLKQTLERWLRRSRPGVGELYYLLTQNIFIYADVTPSI